MREEKENKKAREAEAKRRENVKRKRREDVESGREEEDEADGEYECRWRGEICTKPSVRPESRGCVGCQGARKSTGQHRHGSSIN